MIAFPCYSETCSQAKFSARKLSLESTALAGRRYVSRVFRSLGLPAYPLSLPFGWTPLSREIHPHRRQGCSHPDHPLCGLRRTASFLLGFCALSLRDLPGRSTLKTGGQAARLRSHLTAVRSTVHCGRGASVHSFALGRSRTPGWSAWADQSPYSLNARRRSRPLFPTLGRLQSLRRRSRAILPERANLRIGPAAVRSSISSHWTCSLAAVWHRGAPQTDRAAARKFLVSENLQKGSRLDKSPERFSLAPLLKRVHTLCRTVVRAAVVELQPTKNVSRFSAKSDLAETRCSSTTADKFRAFGASLGLSCSSTTGPILKSGAL